jgi:hypothetical protein
MEDMSLTLTQSRMSGLESLTGSGLAREAQAVAANFQIQVAGNRQLLLVRLGRSVAGRDYIGLVALFLDGETESTKLRLICEQEVIDNYR